MQDGLDRIRLSVQHQSAQHLVDAPLLMLRMSRFVPRHLVQPPSVVVPVEQLKAGEFEYVMQPDGTIQKRKKTTDHNVIIAGTGYNPGHTSRSMAIRADSDAVIEAVEDDTVMDDSKKRR